MMTPEENMIHGCFNKWEEHLKDSKEICRDPDKKEDIINGEIDYPFTHYKSVGRDDGIFYHQDSSDLYYVREEMDKVVIDVVG